MKFIKKSIVIISGTIIALIVVGALGAAGFIYSGLYDIAARHPHMQMMRVILLATKRKSIEYHSRDLTVPNLNDEALIKKGFNLYQKNCLACHGAPGEKKDRIGIGLNPNPPPLERAIDDWTEAQIAWVIANGLKMAGMPAFGLGKESKDIWAMTAFVRRMHTLSPIEYSKMVTQDEVSWVAPALGWERLTSGDKEKGKILLKKYGCISCHQIPGVNGPQGRVATPLNQWARRHYIAGKWVNYPNNLIPWIVSPQKMDQQTLMPNLGVTEEEAIHMAKYLYSLGAR